MPSGRVNSAAVISPPTIVPVQVSVVVYGIVPVDGERVRSVQSGR